MTTGVKPCDEATPALLIRMSSLPKVFSIYFAAAVRSSALVTSSLMAWASMPGGFEFGGGLLGVAQLARGDEDGDSSFSQLLSGFEADSAIGPGDEGDFLV